MIFLGGGSSSASPELAFLLFGSSSCLWEFEVRTGVSSPQAFPVIQTSHPFLWAALSTWLKCCLVIFWVSHDTITMDTWGLCDVLTQY